MKKFFSLWRFFLLLAPLLLVVESCDKPSSVGGTIRPNSDQMVARVDSFQIEVSTIRIDSIFDRSVYSLLGEFTDPLYGSFRSSYITRFQYAPGFHFKHIPHEGKIDSTHLCINYVSWVGDSTIWSKTTAYRIHKALPNSHYSMDLTPYLENAETLGSVTYQAGNKEGNHELRIPIDNSVGYEFLSASTQHPEWFDSQENFENNLMRGVFVESTTGNGCMLSVYNTSLEIFYTYEKQGKTKDGKADSTLYLPAKETFVNTQQLYLLRSFENKNLDKLVGNDPSFGYITSPAGLGLNLKIKASDLQKTFLKDGKIEERMINNAQLQLHVNPMSDTKSILSPPAYLLLLPRDSLQTFFEKGYTEQSDPKNAFLSSPYSVSIRQYNFSNISMLINEHLKKNIQPQDNGTCHIEKDLEIIVIPVSREKFSQTQSTATINNYLFPAAARITLTNGTLPLKIVSTLYQ